MKAFLVAAFVTAMAIPAGAAADLKLDIRDGKVTLDARDVTVRQILAEWARVGQTRIVNLERVGSGPVTLQLSGVPERQALDIILRSVSGYLAAPRLAGSVGTSAYDRILILATSTAVSTPRPQTPSPPSRTPFGGTAPRVMMPPPGTPELVLPEPMDEGDDEDVPQSRQFPGPGVVPFGAPQAGGSVQPGMIAGPPGVSEPPDTPAAGPPQQPVSAASPATPWGVPAGTPAPGLVTVPPQRQGPQRTGPGARPPQPDR